jgi:hypothetical protein
MPERDFITPLFIDQIPDFTRQKHVIHVLVGEVPFAMPIDVFRLTTARQVDLLHEIDAAEARKVVPLARRKRGH